MYSSGIFFEIEQHSTMLDRCIIYSSIENFQLVHPWAPLLEPGVRMQPPVRNRKVSISPIILRQVLASTVFDVFSLSYMRILFCIRQPFAQIRTWLVIPCGLKDLVHFGQVYVLFWFRLSASLFFSSAQRIVSTIDIWHTSTCDINKLKSIIFWWS